MGSLFNGLLVAHVTAGFVSLLLFWVPVWTKKGGADHRKIGRLYVRLMWVVVITAALMSGINLASGKTVQAIFLGFLALLTARPLWLGVAVLDHKRGIGKRFERIGLMLNGLLVAAGLALISYGFTLRGDSIALLMFAFGGLGMTGLPQLLRHFKAEQEVQKPDWLAGHIGDMIVSGIAAYTAFFAFGASQFTANLFTGHWQTVPWLAPTVIGTLGIVIARKKFGHAKPRSVDVPNR